MGDNFVRKSDFVLDVEYMQARFAFIKTATFQNTEWIYQRMSFTAVSVKLALGLL
jgi:hypothetical protein